MSIRRQTLEEWFTDYQLLKMGRRHYHLPAFCRIEITEQAAYYAARNERIPLTALVIKAAAILALRHPEVNRAVIRAPWGIRVIQFEEAHVNVPLFVTIDGQKVLSATVIRNADRLSARGIAEALQAARDRPISALPIARRLARNKNNLANRISLRALHFIVHRLPSVFYRHGGGISVSSMLRTSPSDQIGLTQVLSNGPTALTLCPGMVEKTEEGKSYLHLGIGYDHCALGGHAAMKAIDELGRIIGSVGLPVL